MNANVEAATPNPLYPVEQVVEKVLALPEWTPVRLFGLLLPIWDVDATGIIGEEREYPFFEKIIERGIARAGLTSKAALVDFLGLDADLVERVLIALETVGSLVRIDGQFHLTPQAVRSVQEGKKYAPAQAHLKLYFEGYYSKPLPNAHYDNVIVLSQVEAEDFVQQQRGTTCPFYRLYSFRRWSPLAIKELALREDRAAYHVPIDMQQLSLLRVTPAYLPMYIAEVKKQTTPYYMAFTMAQDGRDQFFEQIVNNYAEILLPLSGKEKRDLTPVWEAWLKQQGLTNTHTELLDNGLWRATPSAESLHAPTCKLPLTALDTYHMEQGHFLHLWCENELARCQAALDQTLQVLKSQSDTAILPDILQSLRTSTSIDHLQTPPLEITDLLTRAKETGQEDLVQVLTSLTKEPEEATDINNTKATNDAADIHDTHDAPEHNAEKDTGESEAVNDAAQGEDKEEQTES